MKSIVRFVVQWVIGIKKQYYHFVHHGTVWRKKSVVNIITRSATRRPTASLVRAPKSVSQNRRSSEIQGLYSVSAYGHEPLYLYIYICPWKALGW